VAGLTREDVSTSIEVWPQTERAFNLFRSLRTQWQVGMGGPVGLNFVVAYHRMDRMGLAPAEYDQLDQDLQIMEAAALQAMHEQIEERSQRSARG
jgi:hypothetical protein